MDKLETRYMQLVLLLATILFVADSARILSWLRG